MKTGPCPQGHADTPENFKMMKTGKRRCKVCSRDDIRRRREHIWKRKVAPVQLPGVLFEVDGGHGRSWHEAKP